MYSKLDLRSVLYSLHDKTPLTPIGTGDGGMDGGTWHDTTKTHSAARNNISITAMLFKAGVDGMDRDLRLKSHQRFKSA